MPKTRISLDIEGIEVSVSSPDKMYFPETGITKLDVVEYYRSVSQAVLRSNGGRPLVLKRYVNGIREEAFYQKRAPPTRPDFVDTVTLRFPSGRKADEVVLRNAAQLIWVVNLGCLEMHVHPIRADDLEHPDELRIDLDPVPGVEWGQIKEVAQVTREVLAELGLVGWPKTSGSRGLHIYVRIHPRWSFTQVRRSALAIAREVERRAPPGVATSRWWKEERQGVFLDYNQNAKDRTMAGAWSVRPLADARISMPLSWSELDAADPAAFTLRTGPEILRDRGDPHLEMDEAVGDLTRALELVEAHEKEGLGDAAWPPHFVKQAGEPTRTQPSRRKPSRPLVEIGRAKVRTEAEAGFERWKVRHPEVIPHLRPADVLVDRMRGRHSEWTRIRVNLQHVPENLRPPQEALDPDYNVSSEWSGETRREEAELPRVDGFSEAKLWALHDALGVTSVEELEEAAKAGRVRGVKGFGPKTENKLLAAIEQQRARAGWWLRVEAEAVVKRLISHLTPVSKHIQVAGGFRRGEEIVDRLTFVAATHDIDDLGRAASNLPEVIRVDRVGPRRLELELTDGPPAHMVVVVPETFGAVLHLETATGSYREALLEKASAQGFELTEAGLVREAKSIPTPSEAELARQLDVAPIPPERTDAAESLEYSEDGLPALLTQADIRGLVHCHTTWSDGKSSVEEMARAAEAKGFDYLTITDHSHSAYYANGLTVDELERQWDEIDKVQEKVGIRLLKGTESDILVDGALDFPSTILERLDVLIASVHSRFKLSSEAMTKRLVRTMKMPVFKIWGHPLGRLLLRREPAKMDLDEIFDAMSDAPAAIEINADPHRLDLPPTDIQRARARNIPFVISADAHSIAGMDVLPYGILLARRAGLTRQEVLNTCPPDAFVEAVRPVRAR